MAKSTVGTESDGALGHQSNKQGKKAKQAPAVWYGARVRRPVILSSIVALTLLLAAAGVLAAWVLRRRSTLSVRNLYFVAVLLILASATAIAGKDWPAVTALIPLSAGPVAGALAGRRWRLSDLGAGEELRQYEIERRWFWQPAPRSRPGERTYIGLQGELISVRPWPSEVEYVPMSTTDASETRLPLGEGQHVFICGGTGTGKTTTARRLLIARTLTHGAGALLIDQKGDPVDELELRKLAAAAHRPFVLFDPRDPATDRWQPLWGQPADVAARAVEPIKRSEPYYADVLRQHLNLIVTVLHAADRWPPSFPSLVDAARADRYARFRSSPKILTTGPTSACNAESRSTASG
jgi:Type IV secretion-system coupling protein DNA-binding domain